MAVKRVLQVIGGGEIGGAEQHLLNLMRLLERTSYEPVLLCLCPGPFADAARREGILTWEIPMRHKLDISRIRPVRDLLREQQIALVHTHGVRANLVARLAAHKEGLPVITTFHSALRYDYGSALAAKLAQWVTRSTNYCTDEFIAVSSAIAQDIKTMGIPESKITVIYNGVDFSKLKPQYSRETIRQRLGIPAHAAVIGTVARLHPVKGHQVLLEAAYRLIPDNPDLYFLLVGDGPERSNIERQIRQYGLSDRILLTGFYPQVADIYPALDIFCLPSLMEGMGLVMLEAMYFGLPVVASRVGGIPELVTDEENGLLVPVRDDISLTNALQRLIKDKQIRAALGDRGREHAMHFQVSNMVTEVEKVYAGYI